MILILIIGIIGAVVLCIWLSKKGGNIWKETIVLTTGAVKTGKSINSVAGAISCHRIRLIIWKIRKFLGKNEEKPKLYSNIPLKYPHCRLTIDHLLRQKRFNYKSVVLIDEFALIADSQNYKNKFVNDNLLKFFKLFGHETKGGKIFINTQSIEDCHYAVKRCISKYVYISKTIKWIPFIIVQKYVECGYNELTPQLSTVNGVEQTNNHKTKIIRKKYFKMYDRYCYSILTDDLKNDDKTLIAKSLKNKEVLKIDKETV